MKDSDSAYENGDNGIQICGVLLKKPFGHQSNKWAKRLIINIINRSIQNGHYPTKSTHGAL